MAVNCYFNRSPEQLITTSMIHLAVEHVFIILYVIICAQTTMNNSATSVFVPPLHPGRFAFVLMRWLSDWAGKLLWMQPAHQGQFYFPQWCFQFYWQYYNLTSDGAHLITGVFYSAFQWIVLKKLLFWTTSFQQPDSNIFLLFVVPIDFLCSRYCALQLFSSCENIKPEMSNNVICLFLHLVPVEGL